MAAGEITGARPIPVLAMVARAVVTSVTGGKTTCMTCVPVCLMNPNFNVNDVDSDVEDIDPPPAVNDTNNEVGDDDNVHAEAEVHAAVEPAAAVWQCPLRHWRPQTDNYDQHARMRSYQVGECGCPFPQPASWIPIGKA